MRGGALHFMPTYRYYQRRRDGCLRVVNAHSGEVLALRRAWASSRGRSGGVFIECADTIGMHVYVEEIERVDEFPV